MSVKEISTKEAVKKLEGKAIFLNVLERGIKLIDGSIHIPLSELEIVEKILPYKQQEIITYCGGPQCGKSEKAAEKLLDMGYKHVKQYKGGLRKIEERHPDLVVQKEI